MRKQHTLKTATRKNTRKIKNQQRMMISIQFEQCNTRKPRPSIQ